MGSFHAHYWWSFIALVLGLGPTHGFLAGAANRGPVAATRPTQLLEVVRTDDQLQFELTVAARELMADLEGPFYTVALHGKARTGKSTLLSLLVREWFSNTRYAAATNRFQFPTRGGFHTHTRGQWFTALRWEDDVTGQFIGTVLIIDSEGTGTGGGPSSSSSRRTGRPAGAKAKAAAAAFDGKMFALARMQSQVLILRPAGLGQDSEEEFFLAEYRRSTAAAIAAFPADLADVRDSLTTPNRTMVAVRETRDDSLARRRDLHSNAGAEMRTLVPDVENLFLFGSPLTLTEEQQEEAENRNREVVDYRFPDQISRGYRQPLARLVGQLKGVLRQAGPFVTNARGTVLAQELQHIVNIPNNAAGQNIFPSNEGLQQLRRQARADRAAAAQQANQANQARQQAQLHWAQEADAERARARARARARQAEEDAHQIQRQRDAQRDQNIANGVQIGVHVLHAAVRYGPRLARGLGRWGGGGAGGSLATGAGLPFGGPF